MTQRNIDVMDIIVSKMAEGDKLSRALKRVYSKRNVCAPYNENSLNASILDLKMSNRSTNALLRAKIRTIGDIVEFCKKHKITRISNLGLTSGVEIFEAILDYSWEHMNQEDRVSFLVDIVKRNSDNVRAEIV